MICLYLFILYIASNVRYKLQRNNNGNKIYIKVDDYELPGPI